MRLLLPLLVACADPDAASLPTDASPPGTLTLSVPTHVVTHQPNAFRVTGSLGDGEMVYLVASVDGVGAGPCPRNLGYLCIDLIAPRVLGSALASGGQATIAWTPQAQLGVGQALSFQALVVRGRRGEVSIKSATADRTLEVDIVGCTSPTADNYNATATWDDGSCVRTCSGTTASIGSQADVALYADCRTLAGIYMHNVSGVTSVELPKLEQVFGYVYFYHNANLQTIDLSALETVSGYLYLDGNTSLVEFATDSITSVGGYSYLSGNSNLCLDPSIDWDAVTTDYVYNAGNNGCP